MQVNTLRTRRFPREALLASLSASAAALAAVPNSEAGIVEIPVNTTVGYGAGDVSLENVQLPGISSLVFDTSNNFNTKFVALVPVNATARASGAGSFLARAGAGKTFDQVGTFNLASTARIAGVSRNGNAEGGGSGTFYSAFRFEDSATGGQYWYGYISETVSGDYSDLAVTINAVYYDNTGAKILTGATAVPEPSSLVLGAFAAMGLGAVGLRKWKADQAAAADGADGAA